MAHYQAVPLADGTQIILFWMAFLCNVSGFADHPAPGPKGPGADRRGEALASFFAAAVLPSGERRPAGGKQDREPSYADGLTGLMCLRMTVA